MKIDFYLLRWIVEIDWIYGFGGLKSILKSIQSILSMKKDF